jgi:hypothetical protein
MSKANDSSAEQFIPLKKAGGLRNGYERGRGSVYHAVPATHYDTTKALCGASPRIMWASRPGDAVTCPRCLKRMQS